MNKEIKSHKWYKKFNDWMIIAFNNPYNYIYSNTELTILLNNSINKYIKNLKQIHYGVGVG
jgi:hypothetical protein